MIAGTGFVSLAKGASHGAPIRGTAGVRNLPSKAPAYASPSAGPLLAALIPAVWAAGARRGRAAVRKGGKNDLVSFLMGEKPADDPPPPAAKEPAKKEPEAPAKKEPEAAPAKPAAKKEEAAPAAAKKAEPAPAKPAAKKEEAAPAKKETAAPKASAKKEAQAAPAKKEAAAPKASAKAKAQPAPAKKETASADKSTESAKEHLKHALLDDEAGEANSAGPRWAKLLEVFANVDRDGDGHITKAELLRAVKGKGVTEEEVAEALDGCDTDHDGEINYAEFVKMLR